MFVLGMGEHRINRLTFGCWEEKYVYKQKARCNSVRAFNHLADLLSIRSHNLSPLCCAAYKYNCEFRIEKRQLVHLKVMQKTWNPMRHWSHLFIWYKTWLSAHGPLGVKNCLLLLSVFPEFLRTTPPSVEFEWRTGEQTDGKPPMGENPLREHQLGMALSCCQSKRDYVQDTHTHTHLPLKNELAFGPPAS